MALGLKSVTCFLLTFVFASGVQGQSTTKGSYHSVCNTSSSISQCGNGMVCVANKCICDSTHIYDNVPKICKKFCRGTHEGLVKHGDMDHQYDLLKQRYTNCMYVDGNLEITSLEQNYDLSFLKDIEEVTGYVLIVNVFSNYLNLTNLRLIRGKTLFLHKARRHSLYVVLNYNPKNESQGLMELQFVNLREISQGEVYFYNNNLLCFVETIRWDDINPKMSPHFRLDFDSSYDRRPCGECHESCNNSYTNSLHCWGEGPNMCQKLNHVKEYCSDSCDGRCYGSDQNQCCHPECAAGCGGGRKTDCFACKNFYNEGECVRQCPPMLSYDTTLYKHVPNPDGKYTFGSLCVTDCPLYMLKNEGSCVIECPAGKLTDKENNTCQNCDGPCPKKCEGTTEYLMSTNIDSFEGCTIVQGNLKILRVTFEGDEHMGVDGMSLDSLDKLKDIKEITGYVNIQEMPNTVKNFSFLSSLETIHGRFLDMSGGALSVLKNDGIQNLGLTSLKRIANGKSIFALNQNLCYIEQLNLDDVFNNPIIQKLARYRNRIYTECVAQGKMCHSECSNKGCWGPGPRMCLECSNVREIQNKTCVATCSSLPMHYLAGNNTCHPCHEQCAVGCDGKGPKKCEKCNKVEVRGANSSRECMEECPIPITPPFLYPDEDRVCQECHMDCAEGCTGPSPTVKYGGCTTCELAINRTLGNGTVDCLPLDQEWCPPGFYIQMFRSNIQHPLNKKQVCQPCNHLCLTCNSMGTINCPDCRYFKYMSGPNYSYCVKNCPLSTFANNQTCDACDTQCLMGCVGSSNTDCKACHNFKIPIEPDPKNPKFGLSSKKNSSKKFACVEKCPEHLQHLINDIDSEKPSKTVCASDDHPAVLEMKARNKDEERKKILVIVLPVAAGVILLAILLVLFGFFRRQRERAKENTVKLTARMTGVVMAEPLTPTDAKPDLSQLRLIKESEMRRGGIIGSGAFGTVYKGFWIPSGENVKIPVAIKVLQEGTSPNQNQELLEEARVMASVDHPCCIRILAVCMASQMMLVTQLMPLGCLLDYIRKHKDNTGSKALLDWCTQIARGMGYLEERGIVHRDLAARNVLVQSAAQVKITDFGLAKLLDYNEEEYHAAGGKMPIKWLALECIQHRIFTNKSDVWSYGVTVWELFTYGSRPYESVRARDVPDLLEKGERLPQPHICTIDVYMIMIKCWMLDADSRPSFNELSEEFAKMARDPGRYLVIQGDVLKKFPSEETLELASLSVPYDELGVNTSEGDKLLRLPSYSYDKNDLARHLSVAADGPEEVIEADDYLQPQASHMGGAENNNIKAHGSPGASNFDNDTPRPIREKRYGHLESAAAARQQREFSPNRIRGDSINGRYSSDPVRYVRERDDIDGLPASPRLHSPVVNGSMSYPQVEPRSPGIKSQPLQHLPIDEDDYLQPQSSQAKPYMDLSDNKDYFNESLTAPDYDVPQYIHPDPVLNAFANPEYFDKDDTNEVFTKKPSVKPKIAPKPKRLTDYYNDIGQGQGQDQKELKPLLNSSNCSNSETTI